jgi:NAD(P)-dependent dehydrogenase (short-subunit alcohol dehydrogenase family)
MHSLSEGHPGSECTDHRNLNATGYYQSRNRAGGQAIGYANGSLLGKSVIVTGASSGIGAAIARAMAREGAYLTLVARDAGRLNETQRAVEEADGHVTSVAVDITADGAPQQIIEAALESFGAVDVLVHNAGIFEPVPFNEATLDSLDRQWAVNVRAPFAITQEALPHLRPGSSVIVITSLAGTVGFPHSTAYCATKGAAEMLVRSLAVELAPRGIRVNALAPGNVHTRMNAETYAAKPEYERSLIERTPAGRIGEADEIAPGVVFLASDAARFVYGATLAVDGGWVAQ